MTNTFINLIGSIGFLENFTSLGGIQFPIIKSGLFASFYSTVSGQNIQLNPFFVTGFSDAESSFQVSVTKNKKATLHQNKAVWSVRAPFTIGLHSRDLALLLQIKKYFGCGVIVKNDATNEVSYRVNSPEDLTNKIIPHFVKYPLLTQKAADFYLFKQVIELMIKKAHLTLEPEWVLVTANNKS